MFGVFLKVRWSKRRLWSYLYIYIKNKMDDIFSLWVNLTITEVFLKVISVMLN